MEQQEHFPFSTLKPVKLKGEKEAITESELLAVKRARTMLSSLKEKEYQAGLELNSSPAGVHLAQIKSEVAELAKSLEAREQNIIKRLQAKRKVIGALKALVQVIEGQCRPKWKEAFSALAVRMGLSAVAEEDRVKRETGPSKEYRLVIE